MGNDEMMDNIEKLLNTPYWIIDLLPMQVPKNSPGQYFTVEEYFLKEQLDAIKQKHINLILKLNCYVNIIVDGEVNPAPARLAGIMKERYVYILMENAMILSEPDDTHLTLFHPDEKLLRLAKDIAGGEGLFVWKGETE